MFRKQPFTLATGLVVLIAATGVSNPAAIAQVVVLQDDFDSYTTGTTPAPPWTWYINPPGSTGVEWTVDDLVYLSGKSAYFFDTTGGAQFEAWQPFAPTSHVVVEYYMRTHTDNSEGAFVMLLGDVGSDYCVAFKDGYIGVFGGSGGWIVPQLLQASVDTWYYVRRELNCAANTGSFFVEEVGNPSNNASHSIGSNYINSYVDRLYLFTSGSEQSDSHVDELVVTSLSEFDCVSADDFEDGVIDTAQWMSGGLKRGYTDPNQGSWEWDINEIVDPNDGYLSMHVWGPTSGNTYGAEAWVRSLRNYNDGNSHVIRFTWEGVVQDDHENLYFIQVTDGYISPDGNYHWPRGEAPIPGTVNLLCKDDGTPGKGYPSGKPKNEWSLTIDPAGVARLYDETQSLVKEEPLDPTTPWFLRWMITDGTSSGFPAGDISMNLYSFRSASECCDCNGNGIPDDEDIAAGYSQDANGNGIPDECDIPGDIDGDGDVDLSDLAELLAHYGQQVYACP